MNHEKIIYKKEGYALQDAIFEVYKILGPGFLEAVYQECLEKELALRNIPFRSQVEIRLYYKDIPLSQTYRADFICKNCIMNQRIHEIAKMMLYGIIFLQSILVLFVNFVVKSICL
jgi:hypothetical protein